MTISENPYTNLLSSFDPRHYYGRGDLAELILDGIKKPHAESFLLWGLYGMGKTSLWRYIVFRAEEKPTDFPAPLLFIHVDFYRPGERGALTASDVFAAIYEQIVTHPQMQNVLAAMGGPAPENSKPEALGRLAYQARLSKRLPVICLDHFDDVVRTVMKEVEAELVSLKKHAALIILLDEDPSALLGPYVAKSPVFRDMNAKPVRALTEDAARQLVLQPAGDAAFAESDVTFILQQAGRHPYLLLLTAEWLFAARALYLQPGTRGSIIEAQPAIASDLGQQRRIQEVLYVLWKGLSEAERRLLYVIASRTLKGVDKRPQNQSERDALLALGQKELVGIDEAGKYYVTIGLLAIYARQQGLVVNLDEVEAKLAPHDRRLFHYLRQREGQLCPLADLYGEFWQGKENQAALAAAISRIRAAVPKEYIRNRRGQGYVFQRPKAGGEMAPTSI